MTNHLLTVAIGLGLTTNLVLSEVFGLAAGGVVVPGYLALYLDKPLTLALTLTVAALSYGFVRSLGSYVVLYGRRRISMAILCGYTLSVGFAEFVEPLIIETLLENGFQISRGAFPAGPLAVIGYVIPGLIAVWFDRQGLVQTLLSMFIGASLVRLGLIVLLGPEAPL
ncbi:MAG: poly-gamma-glutamate biosynthesis protein PgsC [Myxococcota bacterium]